MKVPSPTPSPSVSSAKTPLEDAVERKEIKSFHVVPPSVLYSNKQESVASGPPLPKAMLAKSPEKSNDEMPVISMP